MDDDAFRGPEPGPAAPPWWDHTQTQRPVTAPPDQPREPDGSTDALAPPSDQPEPAYPSGGPPPSDQWGQPLAGSPPAPAAPFPYAQPGTGQGATFAPFDPVMAPPVPPVTESWVEAGDLRAAATMATGLIVVGILAGVLWAAISPHAQGIVISKRTVIPLEQENWIAADGRFAIITAVIGLVAGAVAWFWRSRRGPILVAGLALGGGIGSLLTALVGHGLSSGHDTGAVNTEIRMRILLHAHGLIALEAVLALAAYLVAVLFSGPDDLARPATPAPTERVPVTAGAGLPSV